MFCILTTPAFPITEPSTVVPITVPARILRVAVILPGVVISAA